MGRQELDIIAPPALENPYPVYRLLREEEPVHWSEAMQAWILTRHSDVSHVLRHPGFAKQAQRVLGTRTAPGPELPFRRSMLFADPPEHTRLRSAVSKAFTVRTIEMLRPRIEACVTQLLDRAASQDELDLVPAFANPLPISVIAELLGVPMANQDRLLHWVQLLARSFDAFLPREVMQKVLESRRELSDFIRGIIALRREEPREDLLSGLIALETQGDALSPSELTEMAELLLVAGHETTANLIGGAVLALLRNPEQLARLRQDQNLTESAVEELLRYCSPVQAVWEMAAEEVAIGGYNIRRGQVVLPIIAAANRDPEVFDDPDRLDLGRKPNRHIAFGRGIHFCLGAPLAQLQARIALRLLVERFPRLRLAGEPNLETLSGFRGVSSLPVAID